MSMLLNFKGDYMQLTDRIYLSVPYAEKDEAKGLGAKWDPTLKHWYVDDWEALPRFQKWFIQESKWNLLAEHFYIVKSKKRCWKCDVNTAITAFLLEEYFSLEEIDVEDQTLLSWVKEKNRTYVSDIVYIDFSALKEMTDRNANYKKRYSQTVRGSYYANCCQSCGALQGDFHLYHEPDSPFFNPHMTLKSELIRRDFRAKGSISYTI